MSKKLAIILFLIPCFYQTSFSQVEETCCARDIMLLPIEMPDGQEYDLNGFLSSAILNGVTDDDYCYDNDCPINLTVKVHPNQVTDELKRMWEYFKINSPKGIDYFLHGTIVVDNFDRIEPRYGDDEGNFTINAVFGEFTFILKLIDLTHNSFVLHEDQVSWSGALDDYSYHIGQKWDADFKAVNLVNDLAKSFRPYCQRIYDWERIPESCNVEVDENELEGGETTTIKITDIVDNQGRQSNYFQRIVVQVGIGKINNGAARHPYYSYEVGGDGTITIEYEAPQKCDSDVDVIKIYNSCETENNCELSQTMHHKELAKVEIKINDRQPESCEVLPQKQEVEGGEFISIDIKNLIDKEGKPCIPEEKIIVMAEKGEITNGDQTPGYSVFEVEDGIVKANYRAPDNCGIKFDNITVFSTCETDDEPREIYHDKLIGETSIDISCDYEWSGTMTVEKLERFDCDLDESKAGRYKRTYSLHDHTTTRATISIQAENIDDSPPGFNINMGENLIVSGFMKCELGYYEEGYNEDFINPKTSYKKETLVGEDLIDLTHKNLNLMFTSVMGDEQSEKSLEELAKMLESGEMDQAKLEAVGKNLEASMGTGESGKSKITVFLTVFGDCACKAILNQNGWGVKNGERTNYNESTTLDMLIGGGVALEFTADYIRNKDGSASITGNYIKTTPITGGRKEGCPPEEEKITCTLNLSKRPKQ